MEGNGTVQAIEFDGSAQTDELLAALWEAGTLGVEEREAAMVAYFPNRTDLAGLAARWGGRIRSVETSTRSDLAGVMDPIEAGERFLIVPPGSPAPTPAGRHRLEIEALNSFGSGSHESTRLMIAALETRVRRGLLVLDVGSGSGVLSAAAQKLGVQTIVACDIHEASTEQTRVQAPGSAVFLGSVDAVASRVADVVAANISARVIDAIGEDLVRVMKAEGRLILSGFLAERPPATFVPTEATTLGEWGCWVCTRDDWRGTSAGGSLQPFHPEWW